MCLSNDEWEEVIASLHGKYTRLPDINGVARFVVEVPEIKCGCGHPLSTHGVIDGCRGENCSCLLRREDVIYNASREVPAPERETP